MSLHLSRLRLRHAPDTAALARVLLPEDDDMRVGTSHRLVWSLFADTPDRTRDFLWREDGGGTWQRTTFLVLSRRPPVDTHALFDVETKPFAPALRAGRTLRFRLRAAPSLSVPAEPGRRGMRVDPVWHELRKLPPAERAGARAAVAQRVLSGWLARQGERGGFRLVEAPLAPDGSDPALTVDGDLQRRLPRDGERARRATRARPGDIRFSTFDLEGLLTVEDPALFLAALAHGFGRAKAFGCGLMLIRPG